MASSRTEPSGVVDSEVCPADPAAAAAAGERPSPADTEFNPVAYCDDFVLMSAAGRVGIAGVTGGDARTGVEGRIGVVLCKVVGRTIGNSGGGGVLRLMTRGSIPLPPDGATKPSPAAPVLLPDCCSGSCPSFCSGCCCTPGYVMSDTPLDQ